jgi:hypothetical protein
VPREWSFTTGTLASGSSIRALQGIVAQLVSDGTLVRPETCQKAVSSTLRGEIAERVPNYQAGDFVMKVTACTVAFRKGVEDDRLVSKCHCGGDSRRSRDYGTDSQEVLRPLHRSILPRQSVLRNVVVPNAAHCAL